MQNAVINEQQYWWTDNLGDEEICMKIMAIWVVEFSSGGTNLEEGKPKN